MASNETTRAAAAAGNVFTVRGLGFAYGGRAACKGGAAAGGRGTRIFDGLDLDIREGVVTTLIGANGSGKSTLFNLLTKNLKPQAGSIFLRAGDISALRLKDFAKLVAIVHQRNSAPGDLSVEKLVGYGRYPFQGLGQKRDADEDERHGRLGAGDDGALRACGRAGGVAVGRAGAARVDRDGAGAGLRKSCCWTSPRRISTCATSSTSCAWCGG